MYYTGRNCVYCVGFDLVLKMKYAKLNLKCQDINMSKYSERKLQFIFTSK